MIYNDLFWYLLQLVTWMASNLPDLCFVSCCKLWLRKIETFPCQSFSLCDITTSVLQIYLHHCDTQSLAAFPTCQGFLSSRQRNMFYHREKVCFVLRREETAENHEWFEKIHKCHVLTPPPQRMFTQIWVCVRVFVSIRQFVITHSPYRTVNQPKCFYQISFTSLECHQYSAHGFVDKTSAPPLVSDSFDQLREKVDS